MVLINLNAIFPFRTSVIKVYSKIMDESGLRSFVYSISFQEREIPATNHRFSCEKSLVLCGSRFLKKNKKQQQKQFLPV